MKTTYQKNMEINQRFSRRGIDISLGYINTLRRAEMTLHRWAELECGDGDNYKSWSIERDEKTGKPFMCVYPHSGEMRRYAISDRENGALKRVRSICEDMKLFFYHQTDPRGVQLYVSQEPINDTNYTNGVAVGA
jgi:hypothetical protein